MLPFPFVSCCELQLGYSESLVPGCIGVLSYAKTETPNQKTTPIFTKTILVKKIVITKPL